MFLGNQSFILSQIVYIFVFMGGNLLGSRAKKNEPEQLNAQSLQELYSKGEPDGKQNK